MADMTTHDGENPDQTSRPGATTDTMPIEPPPSGLASAGDVDGGTSDWQSRYESEQRRSRIFMVTSALLGAGLLASLVFAAAQAQSAGPGGGLRGPEGAPLEGQPFDGHGMGHDHHGSPDGFRG